MIFLIIAYIVNLGFSQYNPDIGFSLFQYARLTYCNSTQILLWYCDPCTYHTGLQEVQSFFNISHNASAFGAYNTDTNQIIIAFRGTVDMKNWKQNFNYFQQPYGRCSKCEVHQGFFNVYEDLINQILPFARDMNQKYPTAEFVVTGHSLGAAMSVFAALDISQTIKPIKTIYNFGSPRVGNEEFSQYVESQFEKIYRLVHNRDTVVHMPTRQQGFKHFGTEVFYNSNWETMIECPSETNDCSNGYLPFQWEINDHLFYYNQCAGCSAIACDQYK